MQKSCLLTIIVRVYLEKKVQLLQFRGRLMYSAQNHACHSVIQRMPQLSLVPCRQKGQINSHYYIPCCPLEEAVHSLVMSMNLVHVRNYAEQDM